MAFRKPDSKTEIDQRHLSEFDDYDRTHIRRNQLGQQSNEFQFLTTGQILRNAFFMSLFFYGSAGFLIGWLVSSAFHQFTPQLHAGGALSFFWLWFLKPNSPLLLWFLRIILFGAIYATTAVMQYRKQVQDQALYDHSDMEYQEGDMRVVQPEELPTNFDVFPDAGAHSKGVAPSMILAHMMLDESKSPSFTIEHRSLVYEKDNHSRRGCHVKRDENGNPVYQVTTTSKSMIDNKFGDTLFDSMEISNRWRIRYNPAKLSYNPNKKIHGKLPYTTVKELMKHDWILPEYERQRPGGIYIVSSGPENSMVVAETRAGKGQTIINPIIDMWSRMEKKANIIANDPKAELIGSFYYPLVKRGFEVIQFNLMFPERTNIYNPLLYAAEESRKGNVNEVASYVETIAGLLFPANKNASDDFWIKAPRNVFKMLAFGMIAYYQDQEDQLREEAVRTGMSAVELEHKLDVMWGHVTLNNLYQMMNVLSARKTSDPNILDLGNGEPVEETNYLTLYFKALACLPSNDIRRQAIDMNDAVTSMAQSERTLASVYGVATTSLQFFSDMTIARLTSGRPSQNFDMAGLSFPRRLNVRFDIRFLQEHKLSNCQFRMTCYSKQDFADEHQYKDKEFTVLGTVDPNGWCKSFFKPIFPQITTFIKLELLSTGRGHYPAQTFYFRFTKHYQHALNGIEYVEEPATGQQIVHGGSLEELEQKVVNNSYSRKMLTGKLGTSTFEIEDVNLSDNVIDVHDYIQKITLPCIIQTDIGYSEKPKAVFLITPPNKSSYSQVILIAISQSFNIQYANATESQSDQKPFYNTFYMLDEIGNLTSDGKGIPEFTTKVSIGLAEGQYFIQIYQSLKQLTDVYGESADKILEANMKNITYLKSPDVDMVTRLSKMTGEQHRAEHVGTTVDEDHSRHHRFTAKTEGILHKSIRKEKQATISVSQFLNIPKANAITLGHGNPIWATNQTALPYAYALHADQLYDETFADEKKRAYAANLVPTTSNTTEFNLIANTPDFFKMVHDVVRQARESNDVRRIYIERAGLTEDQFQAKRTNELAESMMREIHNRVRLQEEAKKARQKADTDRYIKIVKDECAGEELDKEDQRLQGLNLSENAMVTDPDNMETEALERYMLLNLLKDPNVMHVNNVLSADAAKQLGYTEEEIKAYQKMNATQPMEGENDTEVLKERKAAGNQVKSAKDIFFETRHGKMTRETTHNDIVNQFNTVLSEKDPENKMIQYIMAKVPQLGQDDRGVYAREDIRLNYAPATGSNTIKRGTLLIKKQEETDQDVPSTMYQATNDFADLFTYYMKELINWGSTISEAVHEVYER